METGDVLERAVLLPRKVRRIKLASVPRLSCTINSTVGPSTGRDEKKTSDAPSASPKNCSLNNGLVVNGGFGTVVFASQILRAVVFARFKSDA